jgi:ketosteroid isomerase-like protein
MKISPLRYNDPQYIDGIFLANSPNNDCNMKPRSSRFELVRLLCLCAALGAGAAWADEYSDVAQLTRDGKFSDALAKADSFLSGKPRDPQMRFLKGIAQRDAGRTADAISTFSRLTEDFPELPEPYNNLGVLYADQNQIEKARGALEMAIRTNPSYSTAHENLGDVYAKLSSAAYSKALQIEGNSNAVSPKLALIRQILAPNLAKAAAIAPVAPIKGIAPVPPVAMAEAQPKAVTPQQKTAPESATASAGAPKPAFDTAAVKEAEAAVQNWVNAWSAKDVKTYLAAYAKEFTPSGKLSRSEWESERRGRIEGKAKISVRIEGLEIVVNGSKATAKFRQNYRANGIAISSRKTLEMVKHGDVWKIVRESVGA